MNRDIFVLVVKHLLELQTDGELSTTANILASCYGEIDRHNDFF